MVFHLVLARRPLAERRQDLGRRGQPNRHHLPLVILSFTARTDNFYGPSNKRINPHRLSNELITSFRCPAPFKIMIKHHHEYHQHQYEKYKEQLVPPFDTFYSL